MTGLPAAAAATVAADGHVRSMTVGDTLADIGASPTDLQTLAARGLLTAISVTDSGQNLSLTSAQYTADHAAIRLMAGSFTVSYKMINLIWDASVAFAPAGFVGAIEDAANYFDSSISSPIRVNIAVGYGEYDNGTALPAGTLGEIQIRSSVYISTAQFSADLAGAPASATTQSALASLAAASEPTMVNVEGGEAKALGAVVGYATGLDAAIGFAADPNGQVFTYDPNNRAVLGKVDFIAIA